jgi:dCTP deaminase
MLLSDRQILEQLKAGNIVIEPFDIRQLGTNSYDVRLGEWYFAPNRNIREVDFFTPEGVRAFWGEPVRARDYILVRAGETILAHTLEVIGGRNGYTAAMRARSSIGRAALSVCKCAGLGDVGYIARWTMEITNHSQSDIRIPVGIRIAQMVFYYVGETLKEYQGKYGQNREWTPYDMLPKLYADWDLEDVLAGRYRLGQLPSDLGVPRD